MKSSSAERFFSGKAKDFRWSEDIPMKGTTNPLYAAIHERRGSVRPQPNNTVLYEVRSSDTLSSVAARFNTTPSELVNLNRLISRTLFSGQIIFVPDNGEPSTSLEPEKLDDTVNGQKSPKPGHAERVQLLINKHHLIEDEKRKSPSQIAEDLNAESLFKFLKINAKYITDGEGVVSGVLLVTPNHLMFDPNVSDALVIEHGSEKYGVVAPMYMVVRAALYPDIMRMRIKDMVQSSSCGKTMQPYCSQNFTLKKSRSHDDKFDIEVSMSSWEKEEKEKKPSTTSDCHPPLLTKISECSIEPFLEPPDNSEETVSKDCIQESLTPLSQESENESFSVVDSTDDDPSVVNVPSPSTSQALESQSSCEEEATAESEKEETVKKKGGFEKTKQKLQKGLRRFSIGEGIFPGNLQNRRFSLPITSFNELKSKPSSAPPNVKKTKSKETKPKPERPGPSYMNMVDDKPELFASLEKDAFFNYMELIPRPAKSFDDNPLYLCLRMGKPLKESARYTPVVPFGHQMKSEYWFSIPREKVDSLYFFFLRWAPERYGSVDDIDMENLGFAPIAEDEVLDEPPPAFVPSQRRSTWAFPWRRRKSDDVPESGNWEFVDNQGIDDSQREPSLTESELSLPELSSPSNILVEEHIIKLNKHLPPRAVGYSWELIYSTAVNGFSLKTLYREMVNYDSPVLLVIATTSGAVFGAMLSHPLRISDHFYGTGESYVFTFYPEFKHFPWAGENNYFIKGNTCSFAIGASDGQFGLWLDDDLYHGCTKECGTFKNECLSDQEDFVVKSLEAWGFV